MPCRILRRAVRYYYSALNYKQPLLFQLVPVIAKQFESVFPELAQQNDFVTKVIKEGANVNALNLNKVCPLELAKAHNRKNVVKILEANGAHLELNAETPKQRPSKKN